MGTCVSKYPIHGSNKIQELPEKDHHKNQRGLYRGNWKSFPRDISKINPKQTVPYHIHRWNTHHCKDVHSYLHTQCLTCSCWEDNRAWAAVFCSHNQSVNGYPQLLSLLCHVIIINLPNTTHPWTTFWVTIDCALFLLAHSCSPQYSPHYLKFSAEGPVLSTVLDSSPGCTDSGPHF